MSFSFDCNFIVRPYNQSDMIGDTAVDTARQHGHTAVVQVLEAAEWCRRWRLADVEAADKARLKSQAAESAKAAVAEEASSVAAAAAVEDEDAKRAAAHQAAVEQEGRKTRVQAVKEAVREARLKAAAASAAAAAKAEVAEAVTAAAAAAAVELPLRTRRWRRWRLALRPWRRRGSRRRRRRRRQPSRRRRRRRRLPLLQLQPGCQSAMQAAEVAALATAPPS